LGGAGGWGILLVWRSLGWGTPEARVKRPGAFCSKPPGPAFVLGLPMRFLRPLLLRALIAAALLAAVVACLAFVPAVQTWVIERSLASHCPLDLQLSRARLGPGRLRLENLELRTGGLSLKAPLVEAELSVYGLLRGRLECRALTASGVHLQCKVPQTEASGALAALLPGLLVGHALPGTAGASQPGLQLIRLGSLSLDGELRAALSSGRSPVDLRFSVKGSELGQGATGQLELGLESRDAQARELGRVSGHFGLKLSLDGQGSLTKLDTKGGLEAEGGLLRSPASLGLQGLLESTPAGRVLRVELSRAGRNLASVGGSWGLGDAAFAGSWTLELKDADLAPFLSAGVLPEFELSGVGTLATEPAARRLLLAGRLDGGADRLEPLGAAWAVPGRIALHSEFDLEVVESLLSVRTLRLDLGAGGAALELQAERPFSVDLARGALVHQAEQGRLLSARLSDVPAEWIQQAFPRLSLSGGRLGGGLAVECREDGWSLTSVSPVEGRGLDLAVDGAPVLQGTDLSLETRVDVLAGGWQVELSKLRLSSGGSILLDGILRLGRLSTPGAPLLSMGRCELDLPSCSSQPACAWLAPLERGHATAEFQLSSSGRLEGHGVLRADGLEAQGVSEALPRLVLELGLQREADGVLHLEAPVRLEGPGGTPGSELLLSGSIRPGSPSHHIDLSITGSRLMAGQLRPLLGGLLRAPASAGRGGCPWEGLEGVVQLNLTQCIVDGQHRLEPLSGRLRLATGSLGLEQLKARQQPGGGGLQLDGRLDWADGRWLFGASLTADSLDMALLMELTGNPAWNGLSARFDAKGSLKASASDLGGLLDDCTGQLELLSKGGTCRLLGTDIPSILAKKPGSSAGIASSLGALLGLRSQEPARDPSNLDGSSRMALDLAEYFAQIPFDQLSFSLSRKAGGDLQLQDISLIAPLLRLDGTGLIRAQSGTPLLRRPLELRLGVLVRGRFSEMLGKAGQLDGTQDPLGYNGFAEGLRIGGSLYQPDTSDLRNRLLKLSFSKSSDDFFRRLLGGR